MAEALQFVAFRVGAQQFAVPIHQVIEVISLCEITPLPGAPSFIEGMIDLRGQIIPVVDMRRRLGNQEIQNQMKTRILILRMERKKLGLIVDEADQVHMIPLENIQAPPDQGSDFVLAVVKHEGSLFIILDLERLLSDSEQIHLQGMLALPAVSANQAESSK